MSKQIPEIRFHKMERDATMIHKLTLNPACPQVQRDAENIHDIHRTVCRIFDKGVLWRLDQDALYVRGTPLHDAPQDYILSAEILDEVWCKQMMFSLLANPTVARKIGGIERGRRVPADDPLEWLSKKADTAGFDVLSADARQYTVIGHKKGHKLTFNAVDFTGELLVVDWSKFMAAVESGIGPAKGYGFGLLLCQMKGGDA